MNKIEYIFEFEYFNIFKFEIQNSELQNSWFKERILKFKLRFQMLRFKMAFRWLLDRYNAISYKHHSIYP